jgi:hypothetical protein
VYAWARARGRNPAATYGLARQTIARRLERGLEPLGDVGRELVRSLREELGVEVLTPPRSDRQPADHDHDHDHDEETDQ